MKWAKAFCVLLLLVLIPASEAEVDASDGVVLEYFYHPGCAPCVPPKQLIEELQIEYSPALVVEWQNMKYSEPMERFLAYELSRRPAVVFNHDPGTAIYDMSEKVLREKIEYHIMMWENSTAVEEEPDFPDARPFVTVPLVMVAGLVDGINPCAFSLLIFFLSFLFGIHRRRLNVFGMGLTYILGVFIGYLSIGLGLLQAVSLLGVEHIFGLFGVVLLFIMGLLQLREAMTFGARLLKFPGFAVPTFRRLTERATLPIALVLGLAVSLFEFPCSGAIYIGILVLLASKPYFSEGFLYLVLYNVMFVVPLILLMLLATNADILLKMDEWRVVSRHRLKMLSGAFLIALATLMGYWLLIF